MKALKCLILFSFLLLFFVILIVPSTGANTDTPPTAKGEGTQSALAPPSFTLSPLSFCFDGAVHTLKIENLTHEFENDGYYTYEWYKDGKLLEASAPSLPIRNVADSGVYTAQVTFIYEGESITSYSSARVEVTPLCVTPPEILPKEYEGTPLYASILPSSYYTLSENQGGKDAGTYPVVLSLTDSENTVWSTTGDALPVTLSFEIQKAKNVWLEESYVLDTYLGTPPVYGGIPRFGTPSITYATNAQGPFTLVLPGSAGILYARVTVEGTSNYSALVGPVFEISVMENTPVAIRMDAPPDRTVYTAFDTVDLTGIRVSITYRDGTVDIADSRALRVIYDTYPSFLCAKDTGVTVAYGDFKARLPLTVNKATYSLEGIAFSSGTLTYSGEYLTLSPSGQAPVGLDGIPLKMQVTGGGIDVGEYELTLSFMCDSVNYEVPNPRTVTLTVLPKTVSLSWEMLTFVYDGTEKTPKASFVNVFGAIEAVRVEGAQIFAGEDYIATAVPQKNYTYENPCVAFVILKGVYDMSGAFWSGDTFTFDNTRKSPVLLGLPEGVRVISYYGNAEVNAGEYVASATLAYDAANYYPPSAPMLSWQILRASYDLCGFEILGGLFVYDGFSHTPTVAGTLPVGLDGVRLTVSFSDTVTHVSEGRREITALFSTASENYLTPPPVTVTVAITPAPVTVEWSELTFTYDGAPHSPSASCGALTVRVEGAMSLAGEYVAVAHIDESDYYITNPRISYVIQKAKNEWLIPLTVKDGYTSKNPIATAGAKYGEVIYTFYGNDGNEVQNPRQKAGVYTCIASVAESENYTALTSARVAFTVHEVVEVETVASLQREQLYAYEVLQKDDLRVLIRYNDGTERECTDYEIFYHSASSLRVTDSYVGIRIGEREIELPVTVSRAKLDTGDIVFSFSTVTYTAEAHILRVLFLPEGVTLLSLSEDTFRDVGEYTVVARLSFDRENYEGADTVIHTVRVEKQSIPSPTLLPLTYTGKWQAPTLAPSPLYDVTYTEQGLRPGEYRIELTLKDSKNTAFSDSDEEVLTLWYTIEKAPLTLTLSDITLYRDGGQSAFSYYISEGTLFEGDTLSVIADIGERVSAQAVHDCYDIKIVEGKLHYSSKSTPVENRNTVILCFAAVMALLLLFLIFLTVSTRKRTQAPEPPTSPLPQSPTPPLTNPPMPLYREHIEEGADGVPDMAQEEAERATESEIAQSAAEHTPHEEGEEQSAAEHALPEEGEEQSAAEHALHEEGEVQSAAEYTLPEEGEEQSTVEDSVLESVELPLVSADDNDEEIAIFDIFPTVEFATEEGEDTELLSPDLSFGEPTASAVAPQVVATEITREDTAPCRAPKKREKTKRSTAPKKDTTVSRFLEFVFAPWHRNGGKHAERTVAHTTAEKYTYRQPLPEGTDYFGISEEEADRLLSDRSAEALLEHRNAPIVTYGKRRAIINIDTLCEHFSSGERVDIEILKTRSLIPYDTLHLKVLARGTINKPLYVFANDFSLCAVKMLLLSGGKAVRQKTKSVGFSMGKSKRR